MAGSGTSSLRTGLKKGLRGGGALDETAPKVEYGYGTPTHASPIGTLYVKLDATVGTTSHYRMNSSAAWAPMSDD